MLRLTKAQSKALLRLYRRAEAPAESFLTFRRKARPMFDRSGGIMIHWCGMWLGIEPDGYCHS